LRFAQELASGASKTRAYCIAYDVTDEKAQSTYNNASRLANHPAILEYIKAKEDDRERIRQAAYEEERELAKEVVREHGLTFGTWLDDAINMRNEARQNDDLKTALVAHKLIGDAMGYTKPIEKPTEVTVNNNTLVVQQEDKWAKLQSLLPAL
jgi:hypothetical protein